MERGGPPPLPNDPSRAATRTSAAVVNGRTSPNRYLPASSKCASDSSPEAIRAASLAASRARSRSAGKRASEPVHGARSGSAQAITAYAAPATRATEVHRCIRWGAPLSRAKRPERPVVAANTATGMIWPTTKGSLAANSASRSGSGQNAAEPDVPKEIECRSPAWSVLAHGRCPRRHGLEEAAGIRLRGRAAAWRAPCRQDASAFDSVASNLSPSSLTTYIG